MSEAKGMRKLKHYDTIFAFQEDYSDREARDAFVGMLSNEEIDELADFCPSAQEKIDYLRMKKPETVFRYSLADAWCREQSRIIVVDGPDGQDVQFFLSRDRVPYGISPEDGKRMRISRDALKRIRHVLDDDRLFETEMLEEPYGIAVMDGYCQEFELSSLGRHIVAAGDNIQECKGDTKHCPHSVLIAETLGKIKEILVPEGVPGECLSLTPRGMEQV